MLLRLLMERGLSMEDAKSRIFLLDSKGIVTKDRADISAEKAEFARVGSQLHP